MRSYLNAGTLLRVSGGIIYKITGEPIGEGGGSILYPAIRMLPDKDGYRESRIEYAIKECFPESDRFALHRNAKGEICASENIAKDHAESVAGATEFLARAKQMQREEEEISGQVYVHAFRLTPVIESYQDIEVSVKGENDFQKVHNMISVMESLSAKGESIHHILQVRKHLRAFDAFSVIRQVLFAIREVHQAGFLHLDIQDGNVFIKGVLDTSDNMVSLIDFGSARKIQEDGCCAEIRDGVVYSTKGFSAPEILLKNDGHLRLGKEADIYSIGCLLLLLLTGHRYMTAELMANKSERYVPRFALRKTGCPRHLVDKMQRILAKALKTDASSRYHSADEMLQDVEEMIALLMPHTDPLSAMTYDAFICYRHSEKDNLAAKALRNALERYKDGIFAKRKIQRVFLDEGELSSCADFGERIHRALENSRWLIVLCSEKTRESKWVNEEIRAFLKYHDSSHILTVLTEGEAEEVYPEALTENGLTAETLFAADARAKDSAGTVRKIKGDAKLRIAAPLLETTYDALKQRSRIYSMQRAFVAATVIFGVTAGFSVFAAVKANQIARQEQKIARQAEEIVAEQEEKIKSQSALLTEQAKKAYAANAYAEAIQLAKEAMALSMEDEQQNSDLKQILITCLNLYVTPEEAKMLLTPTGIFQEPENKKIRDCFLTKDGKYLFVFSDKALLIWDTETNSMASEIEEKEAVYEADRACLMEEKHQYILWSAQEMLCCDYTSGEILWQREEHADEQEMHTVLLSKDKKTVYSLQEVEKTGEVVIEAIDAVNGETVSRHVFHGGDFPVWGAGHDIAADERYIAVTGTVQSADETYGFERVLCCFDLAKDVITVQKMGDADAWGSPQTTVVTFVDNSRVIMADYDGAVNIGESLSNESMVQMIGKKKLTVSNYDCTEKKELWRYETGTDAEESFESLRVPQVYCTEMDNKKVCVTASGNTLLFLDETSGEVLNKKQFDAGILLLENTKTSGLRLVLENGSLVVLKSIKEENVATVQGFPTDLEYICDAEGVYYAVRASAPDTLIQYSLDKFDASYTEENVQAESLKTFMEKLPEDDRILQNEDIMLDITQNGYGFSCRQLSGESICDIETEDEIQALSLTQDGKQIIAGTKNGMTLYDKTGKELSKITWDHTIYPSGIKNQEVILYFPEKNTVYYGNLSSGYLVDIAEDTLKVVKYMKYVVGFDRTTGEFLLCDYATVDNGVYPVGRVRYHTLEEIRGMIEK